MPTMTLVEAKKRLREIDATVAESESWLEAFPDEGEMFLYGSIDAAKWGGIDAAAFTVALKKMRGAFTLRLNSPGGSVDEGVSIFNAIQGYRHDVTIIVDSLAASMASYILQAGTRRIVQHNSMVMIHDPWSITAGDANQLRKDAALLDKYGTRLVSDYARRTGHSPAEIRRMMSEETWFSGIEAIAAGFADEMLTSTRLSVAASAWGHRSRLSTQAARARVARANAESAIAGCLC